MSCCVLYYFLYFQNGTSKSAENSSEIKVEEPAEADPVLRANIVKQIDYYFGDFNLPRDKFLNAEVSIDIKFMYTDYISKLSSIHYIMCTLIFTSFRAL